MDAPRHNIRPELESLAVGIDALREHPDNPSNGDDDAVMESLRISGQYRPVVVHRQTGEIIAGNTTWRAAKELGWTHIAATVVDTDDRATALRMMLADNRIAQRARMDEGQLLAVLNELDGLAGSVGGTGYEPDDVAALIAAVDKPLTFRPEDDDGQPSLDALTPNNVACPGCGLVFDARDADRG